MDTLIGQILLEMRKERQVTEKQLCEGICRVSAYSNYEWRERVPDFLTLNYILERLGHGITGLTAYLCEEELDYIRWKNEAEKILRKKEWIKLNEIRKKEPKKCNTLNENIKKQYSLFLKAVEEEEVNKNPVASASLYEQLLSLTCPFLLREKEEDYCIGKTEIFYYALYLRSLAKVQVLKQKEAGRKLEEVIQYVEKNITEEEEKVNLYPYLVCLWIQVVGESIAATKKEKYLTAAFTLLKRDRKMYHVTEVLRQLISCKENQKKSCEEEKRAYGAICKTYEFFGKDTSFNSYEASPITWMFTMVGEYLRSHRQKQGLTQERLSEGICAVETYSRIEKGRRLPNRNNYSQLSEKLGIEAKYMVELLDTQSYQAICLRKEIDEACFYEQYGKAKKLLRSLEELLDKRGEKEKNLQYLEEKYLNFENPRKGGGEKLEKVEKILSYSLSLEEVGRGNHCYTRVELNLIHTLVMEYQKRKEYERACELLKKLLQDLEKGTVNIEERFRETYLVALNLDKILTDMGEYKEGNQYCMTWGKMAVQRGWATLLDDYLVEISYNLKNMGGYSREYTRQLCETALQISWIYGTKTMRKIIGEYLNATYGENGL